MKNARCYCNTGRFFLLLIEAGLNFVFLFFEMSHQYTNHKGTGKWKKRSTEKSCAHTDLLGEE